MDEKMGWIWRKVVSVRKKVFAVGLMVYSVPYIVLLLIIASTIVLISSFPSLFLLVSYVCTEKLIRSLLPAFAFGGRDDIYNDEKIEMSMSAQNLVQTKEEEDRTHFRVGKVVTLKDITKESKTLLERIRDEAITLGIYEKEFTEEEKDLIVTSDVKLENVGAEFEDLAGKKKVSGTRHEGELESTRTEASRGKDMESSNEILYSEDQIWAKMEAVRKIVGYNIAKSTTYSEELKLLYKFTGVEFPTSMLKNKNQDIVEVSERLCFLMFVIGIK